MIRISKKQDGYAAVEFIATLPILLLLLVAVTEIARMMVDYNTLSKAVRVGARYASAQSDTSGCAVLLSQQDTIKQLVVNGSLSDGSTALLDDWTTGDVSITCDDNVFVTVTATYTFTPSLMSTLPFTGTSLALPMNASTVMRLSL